MVTEPLKRLNRIDSPEGMSDYILVFLAQYNMAATLDVLYQAFGETPVKVVFSMVCFVTCAIAIGLLAELIYHEINMNDRSRTLINKIYTMLLSYIIALLTWANAIDILRPLYGPLPVAVCKLYTASVQGFTLAFCMGLIEAIVVKYIYCCVVENFGGLDDDFYYNYFIMLNGFLFIYITGFILLANMAPRGPLGYCCGFDPEKMLQPVVYHSIIPLPIYLLWLVLLIHIVLQHRILKVETSLATHAVQRKTIMSGWMNIFSLFVFVLFFSAFLIRMDTLKYDGNSDLN